MPTDIEPVDAAIEKTKEGGSKLKDVLTKRIGPLPVWAWGGVAIAGIWLGRKVSAGAKNASSATPLASPPSGTQSFGSGGVRGGTAAPSSSPLPTANMPITTPSPEDVSTRPVPVAPPRTIGNATAIPGVSANRSGIPQSSGIVVPYSSEADMQYSNPVNLPGGNPIDYGSQYGQISQAVAFTGPNAAEDVVTYYNNYLASHPQPY